jgi:hypothetical protein
MIPKGCPRTFRRRSCSNNEPRNDDSKKSQHALAAPSFDAGEHPRAPGRLLTLRVRSISVGAVGAKAVAFLVQIVALRMLVRRRTRPTTS